MTGIDKIKSKVDGLELEFYSFSSLYNLHIIEIKNTFSNAILEAYQEILKEEYNLATLINSNQILFYFTLEKKSKVVNFSLKMFSSVWKIFLKEIEKLSINNSSKEFYNGIKDNKFTKVIIAKTSSANIYFKIYGVTSLHTKNIHFSYKPRNLLEREFILKNKDIWLFLTDDIHHKINKNKVVIASLKTPMVLKTNPFNKDFIHRIASELTSKIKDKTAGKIDIKIVNINEQKKIITLKVKMFLPLSFIDYIKKYIFSNTLYEVKFAVLKDEK